MDLDTHRLLTLTAFRRVVSPLQQPDHFRSLWLGNWLTDMNQATAFFSLVDKFDPANKGKTTDYYQAWDAAAGAYRLPTSIDAGGDAKLRNAWENTVRQSWRNEFADLQREAPAFAELTPGAVGNSDAIGCYYPLDHFDVTGKYVNDAWTENEEEECSTAGADFYRTPQDGVRYALESWIEPAFADPDRFSDAALQRLGHGLHILQDFFAHTNYIELLLLLLSAEGRLPSALSNYLQQDRAASLYGTYRASPLAKILDRTPVMSGRFDDIDTLYTLAGAYKTLLMEAGWNNRITRKKDHENNLNFLLDTFSYVKEVEKIAGFVKTTDRIATCLGNFFARIQHAAANLAIAVIDRRLADNPSAQYSVSQLHALADQAFSSKAKLKNYQRAGSMMFLQTIIEETLVNEIEQVRGDFDQAHLPHHTLLAKDHAVLHPAVQLAFQTSGLFALEITAEVLRAYYDPNCASPHGACPLLQVYTTHPRELIRSSWVKQDILNQRIAVLFGQDYWADPAPSLV